LDSYDQTWLTPHTPANSWSLTTLPALTAAQNFAAAMGKPRHDRMGFGHHSEERAWRRSFVHQEHDRLVGKFRRTTSGSPSGGTSVTVTGSDFTGATKVTFAGVAGTNLHVVNDPTLTVTSPPNAARTDDVLVTTPDGTSVAVVADHFTY